MSDRSAKSGGSFWDSITQIPSAEIEVLLAAPDCTVEDLLALDEFLQELRSHHNTLIDFLAKPQSVLRLVELITQEPLENEDEQRRLKLSFIANEALCANVTNITMTLMTETEPSPYKVLWSFLSNEPPLNPVLAGYFVRTLKSTISVLKREFLPSPFTDYDSISDLFKHLESTSITELLLFLTDMVKITPRHLISYGLYDILKKIATHEMTQYIPEIMQNVTLVMTKVLSPLYHDDFYRYSFYSHLNFERHLVKIISYEDPSVIKSGIAIFKAWIEKETTKGLFSGIDWSYDNMPHFEDLLRYVLENNEAQNAMKDPNDQDVYNDTLSEFENRIPYTLDARLDSTLYFQLPLLRKLLKPTSNDGTAHITTTTIEIVKFLFVFITARTHTAFDLLNKEKILEDLVDLFFDFPWNSLLHIEASKIFLAILCIGVIDYTVLEKFFSKTSFLTRSVGVMHTHNKIINLECYKDRRAHVSSMGGLAVHVFNFFFSLKLASYKSPWIEAFLGAFPYWKSLYITDIQNLYEKRLLEYEKVHTTEPVNDVEMTNGCK